MQEPQSDLPSAQDRTCAAFIPFVQKALAHIRAAPPSKPLEQCTTLAECIAAYNPHPEYLQDFIGYLSAHTDEPVYGGTNKVTPAVAGPYAFWTKFLDIRGLLAHHQNQMNPHLQSCTMITKILNDPRNQGMSAATIACKKIAKLKEWYTGLDRDVTYLSTAQPPLAQDTVQKIVHERDAIKEVLNTALRLIATQNAPDAQPHVQASSDPQEESSSASALCFILGKWISVALLVNGAIGLLYEACAPDEIQVRPIVSPSPQVKPDSMLLPHIQQALEDLLLPCSPDEYPMGYTRD